MPYSQPPLVQRFKGRASVTSTADTSLVAAPGHREKLWISAITVCNSHATSGTIVHIKSGTTIIWSIPAPPNNGGAVLAFPDPIDCAEAEALNFATADAVTTVTVSVSGYKAKS